MRRMKIEAEISARSYKKLCEALKGYNKKQLWKVMDHYIFHIMEDKHVEELLQILKTFTETNSFDDPVAEPKETVEAEFGTANDPNPLSRTKMSSLITAEDIALSRDKIDLLYDVNYFTYLTKDIAVANAKRLIDFAKAKDLLAPAHWHLIAASADIMDLVEDEG